METKNTADGPKFSSSTAAMGNAVAGKTARPCDVCGRERARWYCAADEAYLCQPCDGSVHSANSVARRHERVRLWPINSVQQMENRSNYYSSAFMARRKRTRSSRPHPNGNHRSAKPKVVKDEFRSPVLLEVPVPENSPSEEFRSVVEDDDDLLHQVPIFMPLAEEFCVSDRPPNLPENTTSNAMEIDRTTSCLTDEKDSGDCARNLAVPDNNIDLNHFLHSEADLCEFAVDMEMDMKSIIGHGLDEGLGSLYVAEKYHDRGHTDNNNNNNNNNNKKDDDDQSSRSGLASDSAAPRMTECGPPDADCQCTEDGDGSLGWLWGRIKVEGREEDETARLSSDACHRVESREASDAKVKVEEPDEAWDTIELNIDYNEFEEEEEEEELDEYQEPDPAAAHLDMKLRGDRVHEGAKINLALDSIFGPSTPTDFNEDRKLISLRLNYEDVMTAWSDRGSPWACGRRLETASDDCSSDSAGLVPDLNMPTGQAREQGELGQVPVTNNGGGHGGREARVMRYREKRRTRLFSKKIRYEVRKLNAEKRPRMKGRFVKRTSSMCPD